MKLMLGLLGVVAALTYGVVTMVGSAPVGSLSSSPQVNLPLPVPAKGVSAVGSTGRADIPVQPQPAELPAPPAAAESVVAAVDQSPSCDVQALLSKLAEIRRNGRLAIMQVAPELAIAGCSAASLAALSSQAQPPNAGRWKGGSQQGGGNQGGGNQGGGGQGGGD